MNIAHVIAPEGFGGAQTVVQTLAIGSKKAGINVQVLVLVAGQSVCPLTESLRKVAVPVTEIRCGRRRYIAEVKCLVEALFRSHIDVVHTHLYHADIVGYLAARRCGLPVVSTVHGITGMGWKSAFYAWLDFRFLRRFDAVACVSKSLRHRVVEEGCNPDRVFIIQNGYNVRSLLSKVDARMSLSVPLDSLCIGWVGRFSPEKGPDLFLEVMSLLGREDVIGVLIGGGKDFEPIAARAKKLDRRSRILLAGQRSDASSLFPAFDIFVLSSRAEANPMVALEAIWANIPIVAFSAGDITDMLDDTTASLVPPRDTIAMAAAINDILANPHEALNRADHAKRTTPQRFGLDRWLNDLEKMYSLVLSNPNYSVDTEH